MSDGETSIPEVVELEHKFFNVFANPHFRNAPPPREQPLFCATLGDQKVILPIDGIIRELSLKEGDALRVMLETIAESLRFVSVLQPGDPIPTEVRTGEASWEAAEKHMEIARQRLTMQLVTWVSGREEMITEPADLRQMFENPDTRQKVSDAFSEAAKRLGLSDKDEVANMVESFAVELSYVEALRERFADIKALFDKILALRKRYRERNSIIDEIEPVVRLMRKPVGDFQTNFDLIDAQTGEIMTVLSKLDAQREYVRDLRNDLYVRFEAWQEFVDAWHDVNPRDPQDFNVGNALRDLYRFLAQRYMEADEWVLMASLRDEDQGKMRYGGVMTW